MPSSSPVIGVAAYHNGQRIQTGETTAMAPSCDTCFGADCDTVFAYPTVKLVKIQDRRLGLARFGVMFAIFLYIVIYELAYSTSYLLLSDPVGTVRFSLREPMEPSSCDPLEYSAVCANKLPAISNLSYCHQSTDPEHQALNVFPCEFMDAAAAVSTKDASIMMTTFVEVAYQERVCEYSLAYKGNCPKIWNTTALPTENPIYPSEGNFSSAFYTVAPESFTMLIDHTVQSSALDITSSSASMKGKLFVDAKGAVSDALCREQSSATETELGGEKTNVAPCYLEVGELGAYSHPPLDIFEVDVLLRAAGTTADAVRHKGVVIVLSIEYSNIEPWRGATDEVRYVYRLEAIPSTYKEVKVDSTGEKQDWRIVSKMYGIQLSTVQTGQLGRFDFSTLLITFTTSLALLAVATTVVDALALYAMPHRVHYAEAKYETTEDFSDIRDREEDVDPSRGSGVSLPAAPSSAAGMQRDDRAV